MPWLTKDLALNEWGKNNNFLATLIRKSLYISFHHDNANLRIYNRHDYNDLRILDIFNINSAQAKKLILKIEYLLNDR